MYIFEFANKKNLKFVSDFCLRNHSFHDNNIKILIFTRLFIYFLKAFVQ